MSASGNQTRSGAPPTDLLVIGLAAVVLGLFYWWASMDRTQELRRSPIGFDALAIWLRAEELPARTYRGLASVDIDAVGLRILPLFDFDLEHDIEVPETEQELILQQSEVDISIDVLRHKIAAVPTLVIPPKWRTGMRLTGIAHPDLIGSLQQRNDLLREISPTIGEIRAAPGTFVDLSVKPGDANGLTAQLYAPELLASSDCEPIIGDSKAMLLGECVLAPDGDHDSAVFWLLSDPDLLNSHGLRLGDNAAIALSLLPDLAAGGQIVIDYTTRAWRDDRERHGERRWSDLLRFFDYPFGVLWAGFAALAVLVLWRAWVRYGAPVRLFEDGPGAARLISVTATARLLRISGHDGSLLATYVTHRMHHAAADIFGAHRTAVSDPLQQVADWVARHDRPRAEALYQAAQDACAIEPNAPTVEVVRRLETFQILLEQVLNDFGRIARRR
jgi:hypothetical protein